jgi:hypothetical protein
MRYIKLITIAVPAAILSGCAYVHTPPYTLIDEVPVVKIGASTTHSENHIVYIPANTPFPVEFTLKGSVLSQPASSKVTVSFKRDLYLYKSWASENGRIWINSHKLLDVEPSGGFDATGGRVEVKLDYAR